MPNTAWPFYPLAFLQDIARCLALVHQTRLRLNPQGYLQPDSLMRLAGVMAPHAQRAEQAHTPQLASESQAPGLSFLVRLLCHAGLIGIIEEGLHVASAAYEWLDQPAEAQLVHLRQVWWSQLALEAGNLPALRFPHFMQRRWSPVILETCQWVARLSTDDWTPAAGLRAHLAKHHLLEPVGDARNLPNVRQVVERHTLALAEFVIGVALLYLGLIELDGAGPDSRLRPTPEGAAWLRAALAQRDQAHVSSSSAIAIELAIHSYELALPNLDEPPVTVNDDLSLTVHLAAPAVCIFEIAHFAQLTSDLGKYQITRQSVEQAVGWGYPVADVIFLLARFSGGQVPPAALNQLAHWQEEIVTIAYEPGYCLHLTSPHVLNALRQKEPFRRRARPLASGQAAWVSYAQAKELFIYLRRLGYRPHVAQDFDADEIDAWRLQRRPLPLARWQVLVRTYQHLRQHLPGLADLGLEELERDLDLALSPDDRAAVQRLVESHVALLGEVNKEKSRQGDADIEARDSGQENTAASDEIHLVTRLQAAIESGASVDITYADTQANLTRRRVRPLRLEQQYGQNYLVAYCELRQDERHFRLDRIVEWKVESEK